MGIRLNIEREFENLVEREFEYLGYKCIVLLKSTGFRYGYVGIPKEHPLYGKNCYDYYTIDGKRIMITSYIKAHGCGIEYSSDIIKIDCLDADLWWFGFGCNRLGDIQDDESVIEKFENGIKDLCRYEILYNHRGSMPGGMFCTEEYVANECKQLADQLKYFEKEI